MEIVFVLSLEIRFAFMIVKEEQQRGLDPFIVCDLLARGNIEFDRPLVIAIEEEPIEEEPIEEEPIEEEPIEEEPIEEPIGEDSV